MKKLLAKIPRSIWLVLSLYVATVGPKLYLEHFNQPVPPALFFAALVSALLTCSTGLAYAFILAKSPKS